MGWNKDGTANAAAAQANVLVDMSHDSVKRERSWSSRGWAQGCRLVPRRAAGQ
ncbi:hypothetical protein N656DRAFT_783272 [Canariomyces notabilis]|uniref:Uncharacterized protein n=1 Tax=Canariomyces notabilis TaxID=2074819 RepID=A0AAN6T8P7_9PEZI|nr:hypothetical protein N656DRAFT_783272 [Canariomyces arenarius]